MGNCRARLTGEETVNIWDYPESTTRRNQKQDMLYHPAKTAALCGAKCLMAQAGQPAGE